MPAPNSWRLSCCMISHPALLVLEAKNCETGQHPNVDILEESSTAPAIPGEFLNLRQLSSHQTTQAKLALYLHRPTQPGCELHVGDERIWGNLGSLESRNENLGTVIRGVRQIRHPASPQYIWRANMEHLGPSSLVQEIRHIYALMCKIHQVSLARSDPKGQTGTVVAHLISTTSTQIGTPGIHTGPIRSII